MCFLIYQFLKIPFLKRSLALLALILLSNNSSVAQNYGLRFFSHDALKDQRTEVDLSPEKAFSFDQAFSVSFDVKLYSRNSSNRFGYILRIVKNDNHNIDIVYNRDVDKEKWYFYLISGQHTAELPFTIDPQVIYQDWVTFDLSFDPQNETVELSALDSLATRISMSIQEKDSYRIMFGACDYGTFKTRDVPAINVKEIKIYADSKLKYHWPLNEKSGTESKDIIRGKKAAIRNPDWLKPKHEDWVEAHDSKQNGNGQVAVNYAEEIVYLIGQDQLIAFSVTDNSFEVIPYDNSPEILPGSQAFYNPTDNSIYSYVVDDKSYSSFNLSERNWEINIPKNKAETIYLHHNKHFSPADSSLYIFGGYGQHTYKNSIQKYAFNKGQWEILEQEGDFFDPRYLASLGSLGDTVYILGGYGSSSGDQILAPQHYNHMMAYSIDAQRFVRRFDVNIPLRDICFSNSMVLTANSRSYYTLAFPRLTDEGYLQLIKGSLDGPKMELMGSKLPFRFHDTKSFADLFYFPNSNKLVAYTSFIQVEESTTTVSTSAKLYSLLYPPNVAKKIEEPKMAGMYQNTLLIFAIVAIAVGLVLFLLIYNRKRRQTTAISLTEEIDDKEIGNDISDKSVINGAAEKSKILFFGGFQVYAKNGVDITGKFTPLLKELFLLVWLHTLKNNKGISSERMTEILWFDKSASSARNNKAVNIAKLRTILNEIGNCEITHKTGYWKILCEDKEVYNDYKEFLRITQSTTNLSKQSVQKVIEITEKGGFLLNLNLDWLDDFKASVSETIIETLFSFARTQNINSEASMIIHIADCIFSCDSINEEAMILKCKALFEMGSHSLSKSTYTKFCKDYQELYDQEYEKSFTEITSSSLEELVKF